jgi:hypothetical protein
MKSFFFHFNKPASRKAGHPILTLHWAGRCHLVRKVDCRVPTTTRERLHQPRVVVAGRGVVRLHADDSNTVVATITAD